MHIIDLLSGRMVKDGEQYACDVSPFAGIFREYGRILLFGVFCLGCTALYWFTRFTKKSLQSRSAAAILLIKRN